MDILLIDDEDSLRRSLRTTLETMGHAAAEAESRRAGPAPPAEAALRRRLSGSAAGPRVGHGPAAVAAARGAGPGGRHHHRLRHHRFVGGGDARTAPSTTCPSRSRPISPRDAGALAADAPPAQSDRRLARTGAGGGPRARPGHGRAGHAAGAGPGVPGGGQRGDGAAARRERHRQGRAGASHARPQPAGRRPVRHGPLPEPVGGICWRANCSATSRAPSPGRCRTRPARRRRPTAARCSWTKSAACRCPCSPKLLRLVQEKAYERVGRHARPVGRCSHSGGHQPRPRGRKRRPGVSAKTCTIAEQ